jgi:thiamine-phosphate pyrophosphorylase
MVTVALRRQMTGGTAEAGFFDLLKRHAVPLLPNTAGCQTVAEAVTTAHMAREVFDTDWIKLELIGDDYTLQPDPVGLIEAAAQLVKDGFKVLPYCTEDLVIGRRLLDVGCEALMPWGAPIGTGKGVVNPYGLRVLRERLPDVPLIVDAGLGLPSHACQVMEWGFDGVLLNTAVSQATHPEIMARAFAQASKPAAPHTWPARWTRARPRMRARRSSACRSGTRTEAAHERALRRRVLAAGRRTGRAAERIRARLGDWPAAATPWRICAPDVPADGDVLIVSAGDRAAQVRASAASRPAPPTRSRSNSTSAVRCCMPPARAMRSKVPIRSPTTGSPRSRRSSMRLRAARRAGARAGVARRRRNRRRGPWPVDPARFPRVAGLPAAPEPAFAVSGATGPVSGGARRRMGRTPARLRRAHRAAAGQGATPDALRREIARAVAAGRRYPDARVFINDHWQIAVEEGAYGVHLGQEDLDTADLATIARAGLRLGLSSHGYYEMLRALHERPSYLALGPVFATATKAVAAPPQGLARIARYARFAAARAPLVAIGGVSLDVLPDVLATGVGSVAVVSAITGAADYRAAVIALQQWFARQFDNR